ncbi:hypothetical protein EDB85DRAFT_446102 [Lactarius pseudohatsudake]|nr:hypothetical protein EDB85DRAFT_446102 [Lactarius pseudohatsudake]
MCQLSWGPVFLSQTIHPTRTQPPFLSQTNNIILPRSSYFVRPHSQWKRSSRTTNLKPRAAPSPAPDHSHCSQYAGRFRANLRYTYTCTQARGVIMGAELYEFRRRLSSIVPLLAQFPPSLCCAGAAADRSEKRNTEYALPVHWSSRKLPRRSTTLKRNFMSTSSSPHMEIPKKTPSGAYNI